MCYIIVQVMYYGQLEVEADAKLPGDPDQNWPDAGAIDFDDVQLKYRPELSPVLKGLSFQVKPGEKVRRSSLYFI